MKNNLTNKTIGIIRKIQNVLPRSALFTIYFHAKLESLQYNATLAIPGAIRAYSTEKMYEELSLDSLKSRCWYRKMSFLYKVLEIKLLLIIGNNIPNSNKQRPT